MLGLMEFLGAANLAYAAVVFDWGTGEGSVDTEDVQLAFAWDDPQLESNASNPQFRPGSN